MPDTMLDSPLLRHRAGFIAGAWTDPGNGFAVHDPAHGTLLAELPGLGEAETRRAIEAADAVLDRDPDRQAAAARCERIAAAILAHQEELGRILTSEHGKPLGEAIGECVYAAGFFTDAARQVRHLAFEELAERPRDCRWTVHHRPTGVVGLISPWNFPIGMIAKKLAPAIAAGCPSVVKPSSKTPLTMIALFHLLEQEADLPPGFVNLVLGPAGPIADTLCEHPAVRFISFTGSTAVGRQLMARCAPGLKRLGLELGGNAPCVVFADADLDAAVDGLMANKFRGGGQTCVCTNRLFVQRRVHDELVARLIDRVAALRLGHGLHPDTSLGPLIDAAACRKVRELRAAALAAGARDASGERAVPGDAFVAPTVLTGVEDDMACCREEIFGPLLPVLVFDDEEEVLRRANATEHGLAAYLFTADEARARRCIAALQFGHVGWNTCAGPTPEAPFGGIKQSGFGREGGREGVLEYTEPQTVPRRG